MVLYGVSQGSVLGLIPILLYTAVLLKLIKHHQLYAFAEDTQIYGFCQPSAVDSLGERVSTYVDDVRANQLLLNQRRPKYSGTRLYGANISFRLQLPI